LNVSISIFGEENSNGTLLGNLNQVAFANGEGNLGRMCRHTSEDACIYVEPDMILILPGEFVD
jgi:hypothetical protein